MECGTGEPGKKGEPGKTGSPVPLLRKCFILRIASEVILSEIRPLIPSIN